MTAKAFSDGDRVRIVRKPLLIEFNDWVWPMDGAVGKEGTVVGGPADWSGIPIHRVRVDGLGPRTLYNYPDCVLEPAKYGNEEDE